MTSESRHLSVFIDRPLAEVYDYTRDPANMTQWAAGLGSSFAPVEELVWVADTPGGQARVMFTPRNELGVLDHTVLTPTGDTVYMPVRAIADGDASEVVITVRRLPGMTDEDYDRDCGAVAADLATLKTILERQG